MQICFQADTSALHTPRTMCVCVPVSRGAKSIDGTARSVVTCLIVFSSQFPPATVTFNFTWAVSADPCGRSKANESVQVIKLIGSGHIAHMCAVDDIFLMFGFFSEGKGDLHIAYKIDFIEARTDSRRRPGSPTTS